MTEWVREVSQEKRHLHWVEVNRDSLVQERRSRPCQLGSGENSNWVVRKSIYRVCIKSTIKQPGILVPEVYQIVQSVEAQMIAPRAKEELRPNASLECRSAGAGGWWRHLVKDSKGSRARHPVSTLRIK